MKKNAFKIASALIFPVVFTVVFFLIGGVEHGATCWIGYICMILACVTIFLVELAHPATKSNHIFHETSKVLIPGFFGVQFLVSLIFMISDFTSWVVALIIEIILFAAYAMLQLKLLHADEVTAEKEIIQQQNVSVIKNLTAKSSIIMERSPSSEIRRCVKRVYDELNSCPYTTNPNVKSVESLISSSLDDLNLAVSMGNLEDVERKTTQLISLIKERKILSR